MMSQTAPAYKPLRHVKKGTQFRFYGESQIRVKSHTQFRDVHMYKADDPKKDDSYYTKNTDTVEVINQ